MNMRQIKGKQIAYMDGGVRESRGGYTVRSQSDREMAYFVDEEFVCECPDSQKRSETCKHAFAVRVYLERATDTPQSVLNEKMRQTYPQAWEAYNRAQTQEINTFDRLLRDLVEEIDEPEQKMGRPRLSLKESTFCSIQKVYSQLSSRRAYSLFGRANEKGLINHAPHFNTVSKFLNSAEATPLLQKMLAISASPLQCVETDFAVDSTGFRTAWFGQYCEGKYQLNRSHQWLKAHACIGVKTNVITAIVITDEYGGDNTQFAGLVKATAAGGFQIAEVSADKAYSAKANYELLHEMGANAYIPFKSNSRGTDTGSKIWHKAWLFFKLHDEEFYAHYHKRSNVETAFASIKRKFGEGIKSKNRMAQVNELLCKCIAYNIVVLIHEIEELGVKPDFRILSSS